MLYTNLLTNDGQLDFRGQVIAVFREFLVRVINHLMIINE